MNIPRGYVECDPQLATHIVNHEGDISPLRHGMVSPVELKWALGVLMLTPIMRSTDERERFEAACRAVDIDATSHVDYIVRNREDYDRGWVSGAWWGWQESAKVER